MKVTFLGQGFEAKSENAVGYHLIKYLKQKDFHSFIGISAFASEAGVFSLSKSLEEAKVNFENLTLIVGVDQDGTSREALEEILQLEIHGYIFHQREQPIFHPKIYLFEGQKQTKLILGSSNLTAKGLFNNVESSLLVEFPEGDIDGRNLIAEIKSYYKTLFDLNDPNLFKITPNIIEQFVLEEIIPKEKIRFRLYAKKASNRIVTGEDRLIIPPRSTAKIPNLFRKKTKKVVDIVRNEIVDQPTFLNISEPIWSKLNLLTSDILIPNKSSTNTTGRLKLTKAGYDFDLRTFFRFNVFNNYDWLNRPNSDKQDLFLKFKIIIDGLDKGDHNLKITYNPNGDSNQNNYNTHISWKGVGEIIREKNLTGKDLYLHKVAKMEENEPEFAIVIQ